MSTLPSSIVSSTSRGRSTKSRGMRDSSAKAVGPSISAWSKISSDVSGADLARDAIQLDRLSPRGSPSKRGCWYGLRKRSHTTVRLFWICLTSPSSLSPTHHLSSLRHSIQLLYLFDWGL